jgi:phosphohistidine phosphatase
MPTIILMRHANAEPASLGMRDFDRPLSKAGWAEGKLAANLLKATDLTPNKVFCSPARRTSETLACVGTIVPLINAIISQPQELYSGETAAYQGLVNSTTTDDICMFVGHNPMIERFAFQLATRGNNIALKRLKLGFPTAAIAIISLADDFSSINPQGDLLHFLIA